MKVFDRKAIRGRIVVPIVLVIILVSNNLANCQTIMDISSNGVNVHQWIEEHFAKGKIPPFSFVYGGKIPTVLSKTRCIVRKR